MHDGIDTLTAIQQTTVAKPALYEPYIDKSYGGEIVIRRITAANGSGHHYSKDPPWSHDESLIFISRPNNDLFLNGRTYGLAFQQSIPGEARWIGPDVMLYIASDGVLGKIWPRTGKREVITAFGRKLLMGPYEGRPTEDGRMVVLVDVAKSTAFAYDTVAKKKYTEFGILAGWPNSDWLSISPSGKYIVQAGHGGRRVRVWTIDGKRIPGEFADIKHADMGFDQDGREIIVGTKNRAPDDGHIYKLSIPELQTTRLTPTGWGYGNHASLTALGRQRWALITTASKEPTRNELVLVALDGSRQIRRLAKFRSSGGGYIGESHGALSPRGDRVMFRSTWTEGAPVNGYVLEMPAYLVRLAPPPPKPQVGTWLVPRAIMPPPINGVLETYIGAPTIRLGNAALWLRWDAKALYVGGAVADFDIRESADHEKPWQGDSLEVFVGGPKNQTIITPNWLLSFSGVLAHGTQIVGKLGWQAEIAIPWPAPVTAGSVVPIQIAINDLRSDGSRTTVNLTGLPENKTEPWPTIELA